jgi:hypothetical protein
MIISIIINLIIWAILLGLVYWIVLQLPIPEPFLTMVRILFLALALLVVLSLFGIISVGTLPILYKH